jgi:hypothetical protein
MGRIIPACLYQTVYVLLGCKGDANFRLKSLSCFTKTKIETNVRKRRFCEHERRPKVVILVTHFGGVLPSALACKEEKKQKTTLKIVCFVTSVEDYHKLTQTQF